MRGTGRHEQPVPHEEVLPALRLVTLRDLVRVDRPADRRLHPATTPAGPDHAVDL